MVVPSGRNALFQTRMRSYPVGLDLSSIFSKSCVKRHSQKDQNLVFKTNYRLMQVKSIAECSKGRSILQYFRPSLSYQLLLRSFCLFFEWPFYTGFTVPSSSKLSNFGCTDDEGPRENAQSAHALLCIFAGHIRGSSNKE